MTVVADDADDEDKVADDSVDDDDDDDDDDVDDDELIISCYHANTLSVPSRSRFDTAYRLLRTSAGFLSLRLMPPTLILRLRTLWASNSIDVHAPDISMDLEAPDTHIGRFGRSTDQNRCVWRLRASKSTNLEAPGIKIDGFGGSRHQHRWICRLQA